MMDWVLPLLSGVLVGAAGVALLRASRRKRLAVANRRVEAPNSHYSSRGVRDREDREPSLCGDFAEFSVPAAEFEPMRTFWEPLGFVAMDESDTPYVRMSMTSDYLDLAVHRPRTLDVPMLVFTAADMGDRIERLRSLGCELSADLPRGLDPRHCALLQAPEGTTLLLTNQVE